MRLSIPAKPFKRRRPAADAINPDFIEFTEISRVLTFTEVTK